MASFTTAYTKFIMPFEGGYANVSGDKGGETYAGIARNYHKDWAGWMTIDAIKKTRAIKHNEIIPALNGLTTSFYNGMWNAGGFDKIQSQDVANLLFDYYVNSGSRAIRDIQKIVGVSQDGALGTTTINKINASDSTSVFNALKLARTKLVVSLAANDPTQAKFLAGWLSRINSINFVGMSTAVIIAGALLVWFIFKK